MIAKKIEFILVSTSAEDCVVRSYNGNVLIKLVQINLRLIMLGISAGNSQYNLITETLERFVLSQDSHLSFSLAPRFP